MGGGVSKAGRPTAQSIVADSVKVAETTCERVLPSLKISTVDEAVLALPRGGVLVKHKGGSIQFGVPPDTLKDCLSLRLEVPSALVIMGNELFDRSIGVCTAEIDMTTYYNYFVRGKRTMLIGTRNAIDRVKKVFQTSCFGPPRSRYDLSNDFNEKLPGGIFSKRNNQTHWPDFLLEGSALDKKRKHMSIDTFIEFVEMDEFTTKVMLHAESNTYLKWNTLLKKFTVREGKEQIAQVDIKYQEPTSKPYYSKTFTEFFPPDFGLTVLGNSTGFDPIGDSTGIIVWVNGRGILVDPPPGCTQLLRDMSIPPGCLDGILLTYCRDNRDAGAFEYMMAENSIKLYTTETIMNSFIEKYSIVSGFDEKFLKDLFDFEPLKIGCTKEIINAKWDIWYGLFLIPAIGFEVKYKGEGIIYSGTTRTEPELFDYLKKNKYIGQGRYKDLQNSPLQRSSPKDEYFPYIIHEAGRAPIHTAIETLANQPSIVRDRLYVVSTTGSMTAPCSLLLKTLSVWSTLNIDTEMGKPPLTFSEKYAGLIKSNYLFGRFCTTETIKEMLQHAKIKKYKAGEIIIENGTKYEKVCIVCSGVIIVSSKTNIVEEAQTSREVEGMERLYVGDCFGDESLLPAIPDFVENIEQRYVLCDKTYIAETDLSVLELDVQILLSIFQKTVLGSSFLEFNQSRSRRWKHLGLLLLNQRTRQMSREQKLYLLEMISPVKRYKRFEVILPDSNCMALIVEGTIKYVEAKSEATKEYDPCDKESDQFLLLKPGAIVGDIIKTMNGEPKKHTITAYSETVLVGEITIKNLKKFVEKFPGAKVTWGARDYFD